jgi:hypothetical protein
LEQKILEICKNFSNELSYSESSIWDIHGIVKVTILGNRKYNLLKNNCLTNNPLRKWFSILECLHSMLLGNQFYILFYTKDLQNSNQRLCVWTDRRNSQNLNLFPINKNSEKTYTSREIISSIAILYNLKT